MVKINGLRPPLTAPLAFVDRQTRDDSKGCCHPALFIQREGISIKGQGCADMDTLFEVYFTNLWKYNEGKLSRTRSEIPHYHQGGADPRCGPRRWSWRVGCG